MSFALKIRRYRKSSDLGTISSWLLDRDMPEALKFDLPKIGWLVSYENEHPIAMGFIRKLEQCHVGLVDGYITNPSIAPKVRDAALNLLTKTIIESAPKWKFEKLLMNTTERHILERASKHGFQILPNIMMARMITI